MRTKVAALCSALAFAYAYAAPEARKLGPLSDYFAGCARDDPKLGECVRDSVNGARQRLIKGIPELRIPPIDPLHIERLRMEETDAGLRMQFTLINATMRGFRDFHVFDARVDWARPRVVLNVSLPELQFDGGYDFRGRWLAFPVAGDGDFTMTINNVTAGMLIDVKEAGERWRAEHCFWDLEIGGAKSKFNNLFNGNQVLGKVMNDLMNAYWREAFELYRGLAGEAFGVPFRDIANAVFERFPANSLFA